MKNSPDRQRIVALAALERALTAIEPTHEEFATKEHAANTAELIKKTIKLLEKQEDWHDWGFESALVIFKTEHDTPDLDLMNEPFCYDADTAIAVYDALVYLHSLEKE